MSAAVAGQLPHLLPSITGEYLEYNKGPGFVAIVVTLVSIALLTFLLRVYTRTRLLRYFGIDDWLIFIAVLCVIGILAVFIRLTSLGFGKHFWAIPFRNALSAVRLLWVSTLLYSVGISFVKMSVALFLLRIIQRPVYRRLLYGTIVLLAIVTVVWFVTLLFQCFPIEAVWDPSILHAKCMSRTTYRNLALFHGSINVATDIIFATLPLPIIWRLRVNLRTKVCLVFVLSLGYTACAAAIVRMPLIYTIWDQEDPFATSAWLFLWSVIEMAVGIIAACFPSLKPLLAAITDALSKFKPSRDHFTPHRSPSDVPSHHHASSERHGFPAFSNFTFPRPKNAYIRHPHHHSSKHIGLKTYHDPSSNVTFEIYDRPPRIPRTWSQHKRTPSGFSGFTNFSQPFDMSFYDVDISPAPRSRAASRGLSELESEIGKFRSGYAVSVTSGEVDSAAGGGEDAKTIRGVAGEEESLWGLRIGEEGKDMGRILRTTTTDVTIS